MRKFKILAVAAGFAAAAGITTAGTIYVGNNQVGNYNGNLTVTGTGDIRFPSTTTIDGTTDGGGGGGDTCNLDQDSTVTGCQEATWDACEHSATGTTDVDQWTPGCQEGSGGGDTGGGSGGGDVPANCTGIGVGSSWNRSLQYTGFNTFPPTSGSRNEYSLGRNDYFAIKFTVPETADTWGLVGWDIRPGITNAVQSWAFSRCPGDFSSELASGICKKNNTASGSIYLATSNNVYANQSWLCTLQVGETYYMNIAYGNGTGNQLSNTCPDNSCGAYFSFKMQ